MSDAGRASTVGEPYVKVVFELPQEDDDWPPVSREGLWAVQVGADTARLQNSPWFTFDVANGDLFRVRPGVDGQLRAVERLEWSGICTIRVIPLRGGPLSGSLQRVLDEFAPLGVTGEGAQQYGMVSLEVPPEADHKAVRRLLRDGTTAGWWDYEEACVGDDWLTTGRKET